MLRDFGRLFRYRELLYVWTMREVRVRYKQSALGAAWAILQPVSLMVVFSVIFTYFMKVPTGNVPYPIFSYSALLPWTFLVASISLAVSSLTQNMNLVTKIAFPREILPFAVVATALIDLLVGSIVFMVMLGLYRMPISPVFLALPLLLFLQILLTLGIVLIASAVNVFFRDVRFIVPLGLQIWMYATPVIYPLSLVPARFRTIYLLNPMADLIESYRAVTLYGELPNPAYVALAAVTSIVIFGFGYWYFKRVEWMFADLI